ncbi:protein NO VEIN domain-containing protein [Streptomyces sp. SAS_272]|uniref:protein NO VEIN domain-containing protein n=1 Tax=Streptomyces sp. SAS_272 TaxID=3412747 RepID=UPI00403C94F0
MTLLPSHGLAFGVLLLAHAAIRSPRADAASWAAAAADQAPYWARSLNLRATAHALARHGLATETETGIQPSEQLQMLAGLESSALQATARVLLAAAPPPWLPLAVRSATVVRDYVPAADLKTLAWLEPELDALLLDAAAQQRRADEDAWRERLGAAAEAAVLSALRQAGREAVQVSLISDAYGYDIEVCDPPTAQIEVKGVGPQTRGSFHLTRHEYETAQRRRGTWRLVQVVFHSSAFTAAVLGPAHVGEVLCLTPETLRDVVPEDTDAFVWEQSALITPPTTAWKAVDLKPAADFSAPGLRRRTVPHQQRRR